MTGSLPVDAAGRSAPYAGGVQPGQQPDMPDMTAILQQAQAMQEQLMSAQAELAETEVTGQAGNGLVVVTQTAAGEIRGLTIDPKIVDPGDVETLQDLVLGAPRRRRRQRRPGAGRRDGAAGRRPRGASAAGSTAGPPAPPGLPGA